MRLRENMIEIFNLLRKDETLLRLLYYKAVNLYDDILTPTEDRPEILKMSEEKKWEIVDDRIKTTSKVSDLDDTEKCRVLFYPNRRRPSKSYKMATQEIIIDVLTAESFETDFRNSWICDHINSLLSNKSVTGLGKVEFVDGVNINANKGYIGFRLMYTFGSASS